MATARDIITRALRKITVVPVGQDADAHYVAHGLAELNDLMFSFAARGADLSHTALGVSDAIALDEEFHGALVDLLANRIAPTYATVHPDRAEVSRARKMIMAAYHVQTAMQADPALQKLPSSNWRGTRTR